MDDDFGEFVRARLSRLSRVAFLLTGNHHAAEDLLQSALAKVAEHWPRVSRLGSPDAYVRRALYHEHVSMWRRTRYEAVTEHVPERQGADEEESTVRRLVLQRALARLSPRQRAVVVLRFFEDLSVSEAAQALGCSEGTVKSQTSLALARLRQLAPELAAFSREGALT